MFVEIDSSDIIAFLINDSGFCDDFGSTYCMRVSVFTEILCKGHNGWRYQRLKE